jgi:DNA-directed RNA polymerase specialized sigma24 family protein
VQNLKKNIKVLYEFYLTEGMTQRFQIRCVKELRPLTEIFCRKARIDEEDEGELKSYLWAGYFYAFENYKRMSRCSLWTSLYGISQKRMLDYIRLKKRQDEGFVRTAEVAEQEEEKTDNTMNELLTKRLLNEAGINGLDFEIFIRKRGLFGYREYSDRELLQLFGIKSTTLRRANRRNANKLYGYKKQNTEDI